MFTPMKRLIGVVNTVRKFGVFSELLPLAPKSKLFATLAKSERYDSDIPRGERIRLCIESLGPVFVKFGQVLSTRPDLVPQDIADELVKLQDRVPPFDNEIAHAIIARELKSDIDEVFASIDPEPMASASIAQVYGARLVDGADVVIKVVRPDIEPCIRRDLDVMYALARSALKLSSNMKRFRLDEVVNEFEDTLYEELDMLREASNASQLKANFTDSDLLYVPAVHFDHCSQNVLVMERIYAISVRDIDQVKAAGVDLKQLGHNGVEIFFTQAFRDGFFHADMHPGNVFVAEDGRYMAVDFGICGTLSQRDKRYLAENFLAFFNRDYRGVADAHIRAGWVPSQTRLEAFEGAIRSVCEPIFAKPISEISFGHFIMRLLQVARRFEMPIQPQLVLLDKTLLQIEGLGRVVYPDLDLWQTAKPFLERWMDEQMGVDAAINTLKRELPRWSTIIPEMPGLAADAMLAVRDQRSLLHGQSQQIRALRVQMQRQSQLYIASLIALALIALGMIYAYKSVVVIGVIGLVWQLIRSLRTPSLGDE